MALEIHKTQLVQVREDDAAEELLANDGTGLYERMRNALIHNPGVCMYACVCVWCMCLCVYVYAYVCICVLYVCVFK